MTSNTFFAFWGRNNLETYDVHFMDQLHIADQVTKDIKNALKMSTEKGNVILHHCHPPHPAFAREDYGASIRAKGSWSGTTYKAAWEFAWTGCYEMKIVDADWGIGVIDKSKTREERPNPNPYFEWNQFEALRKSSEVLIKLDDFKAWLKGGNDNM